MYVGTMTKEYCRSSAETAPDSPPVVFEVFVQKGFCEFELASVTSTLQIANRIYGKAGFSWRVISDTPGLVSGSGACIVRAEPVISDHYQADYLVVIANKSSDSSQWMARVRSMRRLGRPAILLADAATVFIAQSQISSGAVTTHWADAMILKEEGHQPRLTDSLSERSNGIVTSAGRGSTAELILGYLETVLPTTEITEIGRHLLLDSIRKSSSKQPSGLAALPNFLEKPVLDALNLMEENLSEPLRIAEIAEALRISQRFLERRFRAAFNASPARFYKKMRTRRARFLLEETNMNLLEIAIATGFGTTGSLTTALKQFYGQSPAQIRTGWTYNVLDYGGDV